MLFNEKTKGLKYKKYDGKPQTVERRLFLNTSLAEEINKTIVVFNKEYRPLTINSSVLINVLLNYVFTHLEVNRSDEQALEIIKKEVKKQYDI